MRKFFTFTRGPTGRTRMATALAAVGALVMSGGVVMLGASTATAAPEPCVPVPAYTETINHPAVTHTETVTVIDTAAWTETIPATAGHWSNLVWHNYTGNDKAYPENGSGPPLNDSNWHALPADPQSDVHSVPPRVPGVPYNVSTNDNGNGSWFLWTGTWVEGTAEQTVQHPAVTHQETRTVVDQQAWTETINHPAVPCPDQPGTVVNPLNQERMTCDMGVEQREGTQTTTYVWNAETRTYDPVVGEEIWGEWVQVRDLTTAESLELECVAGEESIPPKPHKPRPVAPQPEVKPPVVLGTEAAVPTGVNAGLAGLPNTGSTSHSLLAQLMVGGGLVLLIAGGWLGFGRREYGGHQI